MVDSRPKRGQKNHQRNTERGPSGLERKSVRKRNRPRSRNGEERRSMDRGGATGQVTGANATPVRPQTSMLLSAPTLLPSRNPEHQAGNKRPREDGDITAAMAVGKGEKEEEEEEFLSPLRKK